MASLARRLAPALALGSLAVIIVGVADPALANHGDAQAASGGTGTTSSTTSSTTTSAATTTDAQSTTSDTSATTSDTSATASDSSSATGTATATGTCSGGQEVTGPTITTRWGPVQVAATIVDGKLCESHAVAWPSGDGKSMMISQYAIPQLDAMATAQGTAFDGVSGATYTTEGYRQSLQQLLDSL